MQPSGLLLQIVSGVASLSILPANVRHMCKGGNTVSDECPRMLDACAARAGQMSRVAGMSGGIASGISIIRIQASRVHKKPTTILFSEDGRTRCCGSRAQAQKKKSRVSCSTDSRRSRTMRPRLWNLDSLAHIPMRPEGSRAACGSVRSTAATAKPQAAYAAS